MRSIGLRHRAVAAADDVGDQPGPAGLVGGAEPGAVVAVEVLVEEEVVPPRRVVLQLVHPPKQGRRPSAPRRKSEISRVLQVARRSRPGWLRCPEPVGYSTREVVAEERWYARSAVDDAGSSAGTRPARASWSCRRTSRGRLGRLVVDRRAACRSSVQHVGVVPVVGGQRAQAVRGQELGLVEQPAGRAAQPVDPDDAEQQPPAGPARRAAGPGLASLSGSARPLPLAGSSANAS